METQQTPEERKAEVLGKKAPEYITKMMNSLGIELSPKKLEYLHKRATKLSKNEVNAILQKFQTKTSGAQEVSFSAAQANLLKSMGKVSIDDLIARFKTAKEAALDSAGYHSKEARKYLSQAAREHKKLLQATKNEGIDFANQLAEVLKNPFYSLSEITEDEIHLKTKNVYLNWQKEKAGVKHEIDLGQFLVKLYPNEGDAKIFPYADNITAKGKYIHPHIRSKSGDMCWGNALEAIEKMAKDFNIVPACAAIEAFLHTYNEGSAYEDIYRFYEVRENVKKLQGKKGKYWIDIEGLKASCYYTYYGSLKFEFLPYLEWHLAEQQAGVIWMVGFRMENQTFIRLNDGSFITSDEISSNMLSFYVQNETTDYEKHKDKLHQSITDERPSQYTFKLNLKALENATIDQRRNYVYATEYHSEATAFKSAGLK